LLYIALHVGKKTENLLQPSRPCVTAINFLHNVSELFSGLK